MVPPAYTLLEDGLSMHDKMIIFVGGSAFSGSTILDMMLASGKEGFSIGEACAVFFPYRKHHLNPKCGCGNDRCRLWTDLIKDKPRNLYRNIFERYPEKRFIVDSSKDPYWIRSQVSAQKNNGIKIKHVVIWKYPVEFAASQFKRGNISKWEKDWINYYRLYSSFFNEWVSVKYQKLAKNPEETIEKLCKKIGIQYFEGKEYYWNFKHHTLFGNTSAKVHLYQEKTDTYKQCTQELNHINDIHTKRQHRKIYYISIDSKAIPNSVYRKIENDKKMKVMEKLLELRDNKNTIHGNNDFQINQLQNEIKFKQNAILMRYLYLTIKRLKNKLIYR
jgi:hypothetical protein